MKSCRQWWAFAVVAMSCTSASPAGVYTVPESSCSAVCFASVGVRNCGEPDCRAGAFLWLINGGGWREGGYARSSKTLEPLWSVTGPSWTNDGSHLLLDEAAKLTRELEVTFDGSGAMLVGNLGAVWRPANPTLLTQLGAAGSQP